MVGGRVTGFRPLTDGNVTGLRIPRVTDGAEGLLAEAGARSRERSLTLVDVWFSGLDVGALSQTVDGTTLSVARPSDELLSLIDVDAHLDRLFGGHDLGARLRFHRDEVTLDRNVYFGSGVAGGGTLVTGLVAQLLSDGWTAVILGVDQLDPAVSQIAEHLERVFGWQVNINAYLSAQSATSFGRHWDGHDGLIVQVVGDKRWTVYGPAALSPIRSLFPAEVSGQPVWSGVLGPGDSIFVPRGWGHEVRGSGGLSYHLTITIPRLSGLHLADEVFGTTESRLRSALPAPPGRKDAATTSQLADLLRAHVATRSDQMTPSDYLARKRARIPARRRRVAPWAACSACIRTGSAGAVMIANAPTGWYVAFDGKTVEVDDQSLRSIAPLLDGQTHHVEIDAATESAISCGLVERVLHQTVV